MRSHAKAVVAVSAVLLLTLALAANPASAEAPTVSIDPPSEVAYTTAKASGTVDPKDIGSWWSYETSVVGEDDGWSGFNYHGYAEAETGSQSTPYELTGLKPGTEYEVRLVANNSTDPEVISALESFTTLAVAKPTVTLDPVSGVGGEEASFEGEVNPNAPDANEDLSDAAKAAFETTYRFECTPACPNTPGNQTIAADDQPQTVSFEATELEPDTSYTVKLFASNAGGEEVAERSFETNALAPTVAAGTVGALSHNSARLTAYVDANNAATDVTFEYDDNAGFSSPTVAPSGDGTMIVGNGKKVAYADVSGLTLEQDYYWRGSVESAEGTDADTAPRAFAPYPAPVEETCPNEAVRQQQGSRYLPDCRAYELVNSPEKLEPVMSGGKVSPGGHGVSFRVRGGSDDSTYGGGPYLIGQRTGSGWKTSTPYPPRTGTMKLQVVHASEDQLGYVMKTYFGTINESAFGKRLFRSFAGADLVNELPTSASLTYDDFASSTDFEHIIGLGGTVQGGRGVLYDLGGETAERVSLLPGDVVPPCEVLTNTNEWLGGTSSRRQNWLSKDGRRVFFRVRDEVGCEGGSQLYMREAGPTGRLGAGLGGSTTLISGPALSGPLANPLFTMAAPDGSWVFYTTATRLDPDDSNASADVYRYTVGQGNECVTCAVPDAGVIVYSSSSGNGVLVSDDGSRVYFSSEKVLAPGARPGTPNLYVWRESDPDQVEFVVSVETPTASARGFNGQDMISASDGKTVVFRSSRASLNALTATANGGFSQFYRYDDEAGTLSCVSCPSAQAAGGESSPRFLRDPEFAERALSKDGRFFFFETGVGLVAGDVDGSNDIYQWSDGHADLLTNGSFDSDAGQGLTGASADGTTVVVTDNDDLALEAREETTALYAIPINGGFFAPPPPAPCAGEGCRNAAAPVAPDLSSGTASFSGPGDPKPKGQKKKPSKKRHKGKKRKQGKKHSKQRQSDARDKGGKGK